MALESLVNGIAERCVEGARSQVPDLVVLSHLRWDFVFQRPQHLLLRAAKSRRVLFFEEPLFDGETGPKRFWLEVTQPAANLIRSVPHLPHGLSDAEREARLADLLRAGLRRAEISRYALWYYTPMALGFTQELSPVLTVYDCMDELSHFKFAPPALTRREAELFRRADLVFTGGQSLYEHKRNHHPNVHAFPSSVDVAHFGRARARLSDPLLEPNDQRDVPGPRLGFFGVLDERFDCGLVQKAARLRPDWHFVLLGPVCKIASEDLPRGPNIHVLGGKTYDELPHYLAGWDVALLPFALNDATKFISPTKTPEYLSAGKPVVSTAIRDVVRPYAEQGLVRIASTPEELVAQAEAAMAVDAKSAEWLARVDRFLAGNSWDLTWERMDGLMARAVEARS